MYISAERNNCCGNDFEKAGTLQLDQRGKQATIFIPKEILMEIFSQLKSQELKHLNSVDKAWSAAIKANIEKNNISLSAMGFSSAAKAINYAISMGLGVVNLNNFTDLGNNELTNLIQQLPSLIALSLKDTAVTDEGFCQILEKLLNLQKLNLKSTQVTGEKLKKITKKELVLQNLNLEGTNFTDQALEDNLEKLSNMKSLNLRKTKVTDQGFTVILEKLPNLKKLDLGCTVVTGEKLNSFPTQHLQLHTLRLDFADITNQGLKEIRLKLPNLLTCEVSETKVELA